jgi:hypothetical protein
MVRIPRAVLGDVSAFGSTLGDVVKSEDDWAREVCSLVCMTYTSFLDYAQGMITHPLGLRVLPLLFLLLAGCQTAQVQFVELERHAAKKQSTQDVEVLGHLFANSWGVTAFGSLPCFAGDINANGRPVTSLFRNTATVATAGSLIEEEARRRGATHLLDLQSEWVSNWYAATFIFSVVEGGASATAVRIKGGAQVRIPNAIVLEPTGQ